MKTASAEALGNWVLLDARTAERCMDSSVSGAHCLPSNTFFAENGDLASFYHINWVLGTMGLSESDDLLVFSDTAIERDAVAGLLFLAGQARVSRWVGKIKALQNVLGAGPGKGRGRTRSSVYTGVTRDQFMTFTEARTGLQGTALRTSPGLPASPKEADNTVVYADTPISAIARFTRLLADGQEATQVMIDGAVPEPFTQNRIYR